MKIDITKRVRDMYGRLSKGKRKIANSVLYDYDKVAYMTAAKLGAYVGVSESTVVRFAAELGYDGYAEFQHALVELANKRLTPNQRISISRQRVDEVDVLKGVMEKDMLRIRQTMSSIDREAFRESVGAIMCAKNIYVLGARSSEALAVFMTYNLSLIFDNVRSVRPSGGPDMFEQLFNARSGDIVIVFSFPRYSANVIEAVKMAKQNGVCCVVITDAETSPLAEYATHLLVAKVGMASFSDSIAAPISIINAMIIELTNRMGMSLNERFEKLERLWDEYHTYL